MASCSIVNTLSAGNLLPDLLSWSKLRSHETCFSAKSSVDEYDDYVGDLKFFTANTKSGTRVKKLRVLAQEKILSGTHYMYTKAFLEEKAEETKKSCHIKAEDKDIEGPKDREDMEIEIPVIFPFASVRFILMLENKATMKQLEVLSFIFKLWLRRIQFTRQEDKEKYNSLQDFEHAIYNAREVIKEYRDFIYKRCYNRDERQQMLSYYENRLEEATSKTFEEKERASFEMAEEDVVRFRCNGARICALLGLQLDFLDILEEMQPEDRDHLTLCEWLVTFLTSNYEYVSVTNKNCLNKELLASIGFDPLSSAVETIMTRAGSTQQHIEAYEMAEIFIKDEFKYNLLLSPRPVRFPFQSNLTNKWFPLSTDEKETDENLCHVDIINLEIKREFQTSSIIDIARSTFNDMVSEDEGNIVLFHGTDHQSASDILSRGIDLHRGRQKRDFSCGSGFYLTNNFDDALNWANNTTAKPAVLIFQVNRREYLDDDDRKLNLCEKEEKWREIVSLFRSDKLTAKSFRTWHDLIEGPVASVTRSESGELVIEPKLSSYQMCLTSQHFADKFRQTLHSIMFLDIC